MASLHQQTSSRPTTPGSLLVALFSDSDQTFHDVGEDDAYSIFYKRSLAMGWLDTRRVIHWRDGSEEPVGAPGLWAFHDAGSDAIMENTSGLLPYLWVHVGVEPLPVGLPLPTQAFLRCIDDVVQGQGNFHTRAVQFVLPTQIVHVGRHHDIGLSPSVESMAWIAMDLANSLPGPVPVRIDISSGEALPPNFLQRLMGSVLQYASPVFAEAYVIDPKISDLPVMVPDHLWSGPAQSSVSINGIFQGWTLERIGWFASFISDVCARFGIDRPIVMTLRKQ